MNKLILDVKILIALYDESVWINMVLYDEEFKSYAYKEGVIQFIKQFTQITQDNEYKCTYLFGKLHSIYDIPAREFRNGQYKLWYYQGQIHRENDLFAEIYSNGTKLWYYHDMVHRENDLPAVMYPTLYYWYYKGEIYRKNDLPTVMWSAEYKKMIQQI